MVSSLVLAAAIMTQMPRTRPMTPAERQVYMRREGFVHAKPTAQQLAQARRNDVRNRSAKSVSQMRFTIHQAVRFAQKYPVGSRQLLEYDRRLRGR